MSKLSNRPLIIAVLNHKGGIAKTTTACNLAACWAAAGKRVLLADLDAQGNASASLGQIRMADRGVLDVTNGRLPLTEAAIETAYPNLSLLPACLEMRTVDLSAAQNEDGFDVLRSRLDESGMDVVVLDCPPAFGIIAVNALSIADGVVIPSRPDPFSHEGLVSTWQEIQRMKRVPGASLSNVAILLTLTAEGQGPALWIETARAEFGHRVCASLIPFDDDVIAAAQRSMPVAVLSPDGLAGSAYRQAAAEIGTSFDLFANLSLDDRSKRDREILNNLRLWRGDIKEPSSLSSDDQGWIDEVPSDEDFSTPVSRRMRLWTIVAIAAALTAASGLLAWLIMTVTSVPN